MEKEQNQMSATPEKIWATLDRVSEIHEKLSERHEQFGWEMDRMRKEAEQRSKEADRRMQKIDQRLEKINQSIEATDRQMQETDRQMQETDRRMQETDRRMQETDRQMQETDRRMQETDRRMQETDRQMKETDRRLRKVDGEFDNKWGRLMESLVKGDLLKLLQNWGIGVKRLGHRIEGRLNGEYSEIDLVAWNADEVVVVEVKTTLRAEDVKEFVGRLDKYTLYMDEWYGKKIYGAVAYLDTHKSARVHAERQGMLVIRATGNSASIVNDKDNFKLKEYRSGEFVPHSNDTQISQ